MSPADRRLVAEWLRHNKPTRCPTAAVAPTTATIPEADITLLRRRAEAQAQCERGVNGKKGWAFIWGVRRLQQAANEANPGILVPISALPRAGEERHLLRPEMADFIA